MLNLNGANILLLYPYGATKHYGESIKSELIKRGAIVIGYDERPSQKPIVKVIIRLFKKKLLSIFSSYIRSIILKNRDVDFDYILVLRGEAFTEKAVNILKGHYKNAKIILYLWDILKSTKLQDVIPYFDKSLSFDPEDVSENNGLLFRPTFFMPQYKDLIKDSMPKYEILFVGTLHSNRYQFLKTIKEYLIQKGITHYYYLYTPSLLAFIKNKYIDKIPVKIKDVHFQPITLNRTLQLVSNSKCILDLNFTGQKSLSMRAYEAMASRTKYITTNPEVKNYDFYNPKNILVIEINNIHIPKDFLITPFEDISEEILNEYSVSCLVDDLFT